MTDIHTCSYQCDRPECIRAQRDELLARAEAAEARVRELEADAERYRWLREARCGSEDGEVEILLWRGEKGVIANHPDRDIDVAIDTAMQASREGR